MKVRGRFRVEPGEVDTALAAHPDVGRRWSDRVGPARGPAAGRLPRARRPRSRPPRGRRPARAPASDAARVHDPGHVHRAERHAANREGRPGRSAAPRGDPPRPRPRARPARHPGRGSSSPGSGPRSWSWTRSAARTTSSTSAATRAWRRWVRAAFGPTRGPRPADRAPVRRVVEDQLTDVEHMSEDEVLQALRQQPGAGPARRGWYPLMLFPAELVRDLEGQGVRFDLRHGRLRVLRADRADRRPPAAAPGMARGDHRPAGRPRQRARAPIPAAGRPARCRCRPPSRGCGSWTSSTPGVGGYLVPFV